MDPAVGTFQEGVENEIVLKGLFQIAPLKVLSICAYHVGVAIKLKLRP